MKKTPTHLVVDGSNIATEGRQLPSLSQLEEAVDAFVSEHKFDNVIVVVDATFGHRINSKERRWFDELVATNRIITPPAGAIGRGDAFILQIATRASATVLSNDSFQEFHGIHTWLFDEGRLFGGKPVPHVGWVFVSRAPVRGPASRRSVKNAKDVPAAKASASGHSPDRDATDAVEEAPRRQRAASTRRKGSDAPAVAIARSVSEVAPSDTTIASAIALDSRGDDEATATRPPKRRSRRGRKTNADAVAEFETSLDRKFNETLAYQRFRDAHPVNDIIEVVVDRFSSHGAYAKVENVEVYIPTKALGDPPPARARDVISLGEPTLMAIDRYDDDACGIDVRAIRIEERDTYYASARASSSSRSSSHPVDESATEGSEQPTRRSEPVATKKAAAKKAPAKKKAAAKKAVKKAPAKKAVKKAPAKKAAAKKAVKKAPAKKAAAKKAVKKAPAKKKAAAKKRK